MRQNGCNWARAMFGSVTTNGVTTNCVLNLSYFLPTHCIEYTAIYTAIYTQEKRDREKE